MYTIGKLSKKTGVTVRTLDYYDEIGLIKPSSKTDGGHRLYNDEDVMRLERILALKYMGFTLEQIKEILKGATTTWYESIQQQLELVKREQKRLSMLEKALLGVSHSLEFEREVNWSLIFGITQLFQQDQEDLFQQYDDYLNEEEINKIIDMDAQMTEEDIKEWLKVIGDIKHNLDIDPVSEKAVQLAESWLSQVEKMFGNDEALLEDMREALQNLKEGVAFYPMDKDVIDFLERVFIAKEELK
ncbi:MerR family transcriptional regulator [Oceanobacillus arenosus]|uniref:MerR family transcriptional regulator n=1 Tax=Oceanobacillus arenosus TaxID=1229153 RepID=A0A3D8PKR0_9BACI|nr:MerR family transcriptional regulator [Oceanobacillus arenosus]RDW15829.1 MerR family transcriptional regulator [Oceanobacillus arenosus]